MWLRLARRSRFGLAVLASATAPTEAASHVKWFCGAVDLTLPPRALWDVLQTMVMSGGAIFLGLILSGAAIDAAVARRWPRSLDCCSRVEIFEDAVIRVGLAVYAVCLWNNTAMVPWGAGANGAILTAELLHQDSWIGLLQLAIAALLIARQTLPLAGLGVAALYGVGVARYGVFHMMDYLFFLGFSAWLALGSPRFDGSPVRAWRLSILTASLSVSLMWTAIEKFLYPDWTAIVLLVHPTMAFGYPTSFVIGVAGFVEFSLAFYLLVGRGLLRIDALLLLIVFVSAMPEFGTLDEVGHLPLVIILIVVMMRGVTPLQSLPWRAQDTALRSASVILGLYMAAFATLMALYYGLQRTAGWI